MNENRLISDFPVLRLVIPLIVGITGAGYFSLDYSGRLITISIVLMIVSGLLLALSMILREKKTSLFGVGIFLLFFAAGACLLTIDRIRISVDWPEYERLYCGLITDYPTEKESSYLCQLTLIDEKKNDTEQTYAGKKIYLYIPKESKSSGMIPGQTVMFYGKIDKPSSNFTTFDYAEYLYKKGISGTLWVNAQKWMLLDIKPKQSHSLIALQRRKRLLDLYNKWGLSGQELGIVSAVTLGSKDELSRETKEIYSKSGASHVLAVSGLHVGIIYLILSVIFSIFMNRGRLRWIKEAIIVLILWYYAVLIGLPISIVRSLIMFSMVALSRGLYREGSSLNSMAFAALLILFFDPKSLYEVSFQLSFSAVFSIILLQNRVAKLVKFKTAIGRYINEIISVSIAAQIGTAPLVIYYFSNFSTYFLITNLIVIPLMFVVVLLSMILWIVSVIPFIRSFIILLLSLTVKFVNFFLDYITKLPGSALSLELSNPYQVLIIYIIIAFVCGYLISKKSRLLVYALCSVAVLSIINLIIFL